MRKAAAPARSRRACIRGSSGRENGSLSITSRDKAAPGTSTPCQNPMVANRQDVSSSVNADNKAGWRASNLINGDPDTDSTPAVAPDSVVINEISAKTATPNTSWLELKNTTNAAVDISNWFLSNDTLFAQP